jgi:hypothetical protein
VSTETIDLPQGAVVIHELRPNRHVIYVNAVPASSGNVLLIPATTRALEVVNVDAALQHVTLLMRAADRTETSYVRSRAAERSDN